MDLYAIPDKDSECSQKTLRKIRRGKNVGVDGKQASY